MKERYVTAEIRFHGKTLHRFSGLESKLDELLCILCDVIDMLGSDESLDVSISYISDAKIERMNEK